MENANRKDELANTTGPDRSDLEPPGVPRLRQFLIILSMLSVLTVAVGLMLWTPLRELRESASREDRAPRTDEIQRALAAEAQQISSALAGQRRALEGILASLEASRGTLKQQNGKVSETLEEISDRLIWIEMSLLSLAIDSHKNSERAE